eukprot:CAMPEP_0184754998 /NCGR_PEP_ID=MMETSP0315-20130426/44919_1 /TAXON_ID=101924 /ORGANISM="Rhodosorus marinus, Strain UTEX LB 2760" /LENGTH=285 /DNA_ID=CAMNT_0027234457 /DNA_START=682 /DNA_END=1539 /DNA_ORIENTATION=-
MLVEEELLHCLETSGIVRARRKMWRSIPESFRGGDAVKVWVTAEAAFNNYEALRKGQMMLERGLISSVGGRRKKFDVNTFYKITRAESGILDVAFEEPDQKLLVRLVMDNIVVETKSRSSKFPSYFSASEAVKLWVARGTVPTVHMAVKVGKKLVESRLIEPVGHRRPFANKNRYFAVTVAQQEDYAAADDLVAFLEGNDGKKRGSVVFKNFVTSIVVNNKSSLETVHAEFVDVEPEREDRASGLGSRLSAIRHSLVSIGGNDITFEEEDLSIPFFEPKSVPFFG